MKLIKNLTAKEIIKKLNDLNIKIEHLICIVENDRYSYENDDEHESFEELKNKFKDNFGEAFLVYSKGGGTGEGEEVVRVIYFKYFNVYLKTIGYYSSYNGTDWEYATIEEVFPSLIKTVVFNEKDKNPKSYNSIKEYLEEKLKEEEEEEF